MIGVKNGMKNDDLFFHQIEEAKRGLYGEQGEGEKNKIGKKWYKYKNGHVMLRMPIKKTASSLRACSCHSTCGCDDTAHPS